MSLALLNLAVRPALARPPTKATALSAAPARAANAPTDAPKSPAASAAALAKQTRQASKDMAHKQVKALIERMRMLKQYASDDPKVMARQLAQIVKELKGALKAYADAGGSTASLGGTRQGSAAPPTAETPDDASDTSPDPVPADPVPTDPGGKRLYQSMKEGIDSEAISDMTFVKEVRDFGKSIRDLLTKARIQTAIKGPDDETKQAFEDGDEGLKDIDEALDGIDRGIRASSPEAGMFVALYA